MTYRIVHTSDIHVWDFPINPVLWFGKRALGLGNLMVRRARKFRKEFLLDLVGEVERDCPDHLILSGDLSTTSLPSEFEKIRLAFEPWVRDPRRSTVIPGNHDRYTQWAHRRQLFERHFGVTTDNRPYPFVKNLAPGLDLIGFDPCRPQPFSARGLARLDHIAALQSLVANLEEGNTRCLLFACHYPGEVPADHLHHEKGHEMINAGLVVASLESLGVPIYWLHGHLHYPWKYRSPSVPNLVYLNPGAPLLRRSCGVTFGRWVLDWDREVLAAEWRSTPESKDLLVVYS